LSLTRYWDLDYSRQEDGGVRVVERTRELLEESVRVHLVSDVPVGVFLSGGIDSPALNALAAQHHTHLKTLSVVFDEAAYDESRYARLVAEKYATEHVECRVTAQDFWDALPRIFAAMDQPTVDGVNTYFVSQAAKQAGLKVVLTGLGGDEVFWGYKHFAQIARWGGALRALEANPVARAAAIAVGRALNKPALEKVKYLRERDGGYWLIRGLFAPREIKRLLPDSEPVEMELPRNGSGFSTDRLAYLETKLYLQNQLLKDTDVMSMAHSVEARVPFLDHRLVEYVARVPSAMKLVLSPSFSSASLRAGLRVNSAEAIDSQTPKLLLVKALGDQLPREIVYRPKQGFTFPFAQWIKQYNRELRQMIAKNGLDVKAANEVWERFLRGQVHWSRPWALVVLARWRQDASCS
jgi:asparagine synthase (glutamine-hydrolysing)